MKTITRMTFRIKVGITIVFLLSGTLLLASAFRAAHSARIWAFANTRPQGLSQKECAEEYPILALLGAFEVVDDEDELYEKADAILVKIRLSKLFGMALLLAGGISGVLAIRHLKREPRRRQGGTPTT